VSALAVKDPKILEAKYVIAPDKTPIMIPKNAIIKPIYSSQGGEPKLPG
tara:strand:+ start:106 stop:252 length:147 start_codon:yes stop_codon:yes gene_type:complete